MDVGEVHGLVVFFDDAVGLVAGAVAVGEALDVAPFALQLCRLFDERIVAGDGSFRTAGTLRATVACRAGPTFHDLVLEELGQMPEFVSLGRAVHWLPNPLLRSGVGKSVLHLLVALAGLLHIILHSLEASLIFRSGSGSHLSRYLR